MIHIHNDDVVRFIDDPYFFDRMAHVFPLFFLLEGAFDIGHLRYRPRGIHQPFFLLALLCMLNIADQGQ